MGASTGVRFEKTQTRTEATHWDYFLDQGKMIPLYLEFVLPSGSSLRKTSDDVVVHAFDKVRVL